MRNRALTLMVVALLAVGLAWAGGDKNHDPAAVAAKLQQKLDLSDTQTQQVQALIEQMHGRWAEIKAGAKDDEAKAEAKQALKADYLAQLKTILTEEQFARYQQMKAEYSRKKGS